jgi:hypothetical protein
VSDHTAGEEHDGYDGAAERNLFELEQIKDPLLGYVPMERMARAIEFTENLKAVKRRSRTAESLTWTERGPIYDLVGASANSRGPGTHYTAGRTRAILIDTLNDASGNTVFLGAISGGLWKCTNFLSVTPNWQPVNDRFDNLAISYLAQDPSNAAVMYFSTGEAASNADAVYGGGIWKSTNAGASWTKISGTENFVRTFRIVCDAAGNIYVANRSESNPASRSSGLYRSKDGGSTWTSITPSGLTNGISICTDIEISSTGRLHASFGYSNSVVQHLYTDDPSNVTTASGWNTSTGIRLNTAVTAGRLELAVQGNIVYGITTNFSNNIDSCYKSTDGGATWTKQNSAVFTTGLTNTQGWYNITLAINPSNSNEIVMGGLDAYKSSNSGSTISRLTYWVTSSPYVHADHHFIQWWNISGNSRMVIGGDGGVFLSNDGGVSFADRNRNLAIKQFYAGAIHPDAGSNYLLAGAQDNGVHQFTNAGLSWSTEVNGGDGCFVHINQQNPQVQFGSYIRNQYNRSTDGGATWSSFVLSSTHGLFVNPFDYDDGQNIMYASYGVSASPNNTILRWKDADAGTSWSTIELSALVRSSNSNATTLKVSPYTRDRIYIGSSRGKLVRLDNAATVTTATASANTTDLTGAGFPVANLSCINTGSSENTLVAVFSNYGVGHVYVSTNAGASWTNVDGNLPDMPVRWAVYNPQSDSKLYLATEAGVYYTDAINGSSTVWTSDPGFPTVKTNMLKVRPSDNTLLAVTHGRGLYTATLPATPEIRFNYPFQTVSEAATVASLQPCKNYRDYTVNVSSVVPPSGDATVTYAVQTGNTAVEGQDFDFTTNGSFTAPSKQHVFISGQGGTKSITIRVYDNDAMESARSFKFGYVISGSTNATVGSYNNFEFTITDNDALPVPSANGTAVIGSGNFGGYIQPLRSEYAKARSQFIYTAAELVASGLGAGNITSLGLNVITKNTAAGFVYNGLTISLKSTVTTAFSSVSFESGAVPCYSGNFSTTTGLNTLYFSTPFYWDGTSNLLVEICYDNTTTTASGVNDNVSCNSTTDVRGIWNRATAGTGCSLSAAFSSAGGTFVRPDISLGGFLSNNKVATKLNSAKSAFLGDSKHIPFYTSNNVIAIINNQSVFNYGCTEVKIDRAGTGAVAFWDNVPSHYVLSKTFYVTPVTNSTTGQYNVTLYFTADEKAGWEAATGNSWNNIKLIKTQAAVSDVTPANPGGAGTVEIVTPTLGVYGTDYTLSYTFTSGFSGFGAGIPGTNPLPVTLLRFEGRVENNAGILTWTTSSEQNSRSFEVEKSTDGVSFYKIGSLAAAGNSSSKKDYQFRDAQLSAENFYRLRMTDLDGRFRQSKVVQLSFNNAVQKVVVVNNPFRESLTIRFSREAKQAKFFLLAANGTLVSAKEFKNLTSQITWFLPSSVSAGSYILRSVVDGKQFTQKIVKQ